MATPCNINHISRRGRSISGHEVYLDAAYCPHGEKNNRVNVIFKKNKYGDPQFSRFEVAFSHLARLFLPYNSTPWQKLVVDDSNKILGLVIEHLCYVIEKNEGLGRAFYSLKNAASPFELKKKKVSCAEKIPMYFLDKLPHGFFHSLIDAEQLNLLSIDYSSLANIFTSAYTLEEDDLHKGNFGFYLVEHEEKPRAVFFKIDNDLMFADSIMSFYSSRPTHWGNSDDAFDISAYDLLNFPNIKDSCNSYWPTKYSFFPNPWSCKEYHNTKEVHAFSHLKDKPEFKRAKWLAFYKHVLVPEELLVRELKQCLDENDSCDRAQIALIAEATIVRQARLRTMLFSLDEFRLFVAGLSFEDKSSLVGEITQSCVASDKELLSSQLQSIIAHQQTLCVSEHGINDEDTPLHIAIKLGDYRYDETMQKYGGFINQKSKGKTPLDVALAMLDSNTTDFSDVRQDLRFTMRHLLRHGAKQSPEFKAFNRNEQVERYNFQTSYMQKTVEAKTYQEFKDILRDIGEDHRFCLKYKKNLATECVSKYVKENRTNPESRKNLLQLKKDIGGESSRSERSGLQYIRQLSSRFWIIRLIYGLFGWTPAQGEINNIIDRELEKLRPPEVDWFSFFNYNTPPDPQDALSSTLKLN
ncbi:Dot/Icm T4SS effector AnkK/LegA5 [uncultured Legionella sp.]|uniref:Dot/Icm T4SS effector AnkK/LegA5 n=1 Tax=uncultured Legionella sp. TaxID=210934 RepID=UPI002619F55A|nr:Dot/Icm T4SS effector AnkK/LegA5 [uncultured Legionella sp.]